MPKLSVAFLTLLLTGLPAAVSAAGRAPAAQASPLAGAWMVVEIDGTRPLLGSEPRLSFGRSEFAGGTGCNSMQGRFTVRDGRFRTGPVMQTQRACGPPLSAQERRLVRLLESAPRIMRLARGELALVDRRGRLRLVRDSSRAMPPLR